MIGSIWSLQSLQSIDFASGAAVEAAAELLLASSSSPDEVQPARTAGSRSREPRTARGVRRCGYTVIHPRTATCGWQSQPSAAGSAAQHLGEVVADRDVELVVRAGAGLTVGAPPHELAGVPQPAALQLVVLDLHDQLRAQRHPGQVLAGVPAAGRARHPALAVGCAVPSLGLRVGPVLPRVAVQRLG